MALESLAVLSAVGSAAATAAPYAALAGTAIGAVGQWQQAQAQANANLQRKLQLEQQAQMAEIEANAIEKAAGQQRAAAQQAAELEGRKAAMLSSKQQAQLAASGADISGSAIDLLGQTAQQGELNSELRLWEGENNARAYEQQAASRRAGASTARYSASTMQLTDSSLPWRMASGILTGVSSAGAQFLKQPKAPSGGYYYDPSTPYGGYDAGWKNMDIAYG